MQLLVAIFKHDMMQLFQLQRRPVQLLVAIEKHDMMGSPVPLTSRPIDDLLLGTAI